MLEPKVLDVCESVEMDHFCFKQSDTNSKRLTVPKSEQTRAVLIALSTAGATFCSYIDSNNGQRNSHLLSRRQWSKSLLHFPTPNTPPPCSVAAPKAALNTLKYSTSFEQKSTLQSPLVSLGLCQEEISSKCLIPEGQVETLRQDPSAPCSLLRLLRSGLITSPKCAYFAHFKTQGWADSTT